MRITEKDRRSHDRRATDDRDKLNRTTRQLRAALTRNAKTFDQGAAMIVAALHCLLEEHNWRLYGKADCNRVLDALRDKIRRPQEIPVFARGTRDFVDPAMSEADTLPISAPGEPDE